MIVKRIHNLDLFRAAAIILVVFYHVTQMLFSGTSLNPQLYNWGKYGVELFFVLSGFLIGGLFYKQRTSVNLFKFWLQRVLRTYPPYLIALFVSFASVYFARGETFDLGFLVFFQNFYQEIPYFLVSWSLCVEEHFYLFFPLIVFISEKFIKKLYFQLGFWIIIAALPTIFRICFGDVHQEEFGFTKTASIFRFDGIALGCLLSFLVYRVRLNIKFSFFHQITILLMVVGAFYINVVFEKSFLSYCFGYTFLSLSLFFLVALLYYASPMAISKRKFIGILASMAYSIYLTHALTIHFVVKVASIFSLSPLIASLLAYVIIFVVGYCFYHLIEKPSLRLRNFLLEERKINYYKTLPLLEQCYQLFSISDRKNNT